LDVEKAVDGDEPVWEPVADIIAQMMGPDFGAAGLNLGERLLNDGWLQYSGPRQTEMK
jgi:hypothetical protein